MKQHFKPRFESVKAEECKRIYSLLYYSLGHLSLILPSISEITTSECFLVKPKRRGLPLLRLVLSGAPLSPLASSYAQRFIEHAFTGLEKVCPHWGNYCLPFSALSTAQGSLGSGETLPTIRSSSSSEFWCMV